MPAAESLIPGLDDVDLGSSPADHEKPNWAPTVAKKSKKKKGRKNGEVVAPPPEEEERVFGEPVAATVSSSEEEQGVVLREEFAEEAVAARASEQNGFASKLTEQNGFAQANGGYDDDGLDEEPVFHFKEHDEPTEPEPVVRREVAAPSPATVSPRPSPRPAAARPVASSLSPVSRHATPYGTAEQYGGANNYRPNGSTAYPRRESYTSRTSPGQHYVEPVARISPSQRYVEPVPRASPHQRFVEPVAPPHMPQPHFYGLPDFGLNLAQKKEPATKAAGSDGYCCCFDTFADSGDAASSRRARTALLVGSEGGLEVFRVLPNKFEVIGRLEGLRGSVVGAKILPQVGLVDVLQSLRPLVAVVVHGAIKNTIMNGDRRATQAASTYYQTTVEVYSLQSQEHVATLYRSPVVTDEQPTGQMPRRPGPFGDLKIAAGGSFVTIASGKSGEVFVFTHVPTLANPDPYFRCIGKFWTCLQSSLDKSASRPTSASEGADALDESDHKSSVPLFSLSQRWLAIVPPSTASHVSMQGTPLLSNYNLNPPGLASHVAPPQPSITCDIAGVDAEGTWSRVTRQAAQGLVRYSQKGIEIGWQGWSELVNPSTQGNQQHGRTPSREDHFPPTKAPPDDPRWRLDEPAVVSIIDLETLVDAEELKPKYPPAPMATIALEEGCNHLSISSNGLRLLTVNRTGEASSIWDLRQARHGVVKYSVSDNDEAIIRSPCVKQIIRIPRSSHSVVAESVWSRDDEYLAMLTTHGTIHLHEIPANAATRKRKRKVTPTAAAPEKAQATVSVTHGVSPPSNQGFFGSLRSSLQQVSTQVGTMRANNTVSLGIPTLAGLRETAASTSHAGSRLLAKGLSQGLSAARSGATEYWHAEDNKIRHKALQDTVSAGSMRWVKRQSGTLLAVAAGGTVHLHPITRVERRKGDELVSGLKHDKHQKKHFELPPIRASKDERGTRQVNRADDCATAGPHGFWGLRLSSPEPQRRNSRASRTSRRPPAQANEVETNPPYCPFHIDARVSIFAFDDATPGSQINLRARNAPDPRTAFFTQGQHDEADSSPVQDHDRWVFGGPLPASTKLNTHEEQLANELDIHDEGLTDADMDGLAEQVESRLTVRSAGEGQGEQIRVHSKMMHPLRDRADEVEVLDDEEEEDEFGGM
ncbi:hypothetical protein LTR09_001155 [Extremus antarcticus]|uniref:Uncharacterized protein n=1 Tax=Extremus antarcticus TaxID=702011 RepID=A0AAJ0GI77_9PEZI|nr:hypothetical protein LTR09_001155 [Extremus antarcticus]